MKRTDEAKKEKKLKKCQKWLCVHTRRELSQSLHIVFEFSRTWELSSSLHHSVYYIRCYCVAQNGAKFERDRKAHKKQTKSALENRTNEKNPKKKDSQSE